VRIGTLCVAALLLSSTGALAIAPAPNAALNLDRVVAAKAAQNARGHVNSVAGVAGDTIDSAIPIASLPFSDSGNTCQFADDYNAICPYTATGSPDVVYSYAPPSDVSVDVDLCASTYDTKLYVFEDVADNVIACNDDYCGSDGWKSEVTGVALQAGHTYYVIVDGYSATDCGTYHLNVLAHEDCVVLCPPGSQLEGEPICTDDYYDAYNGGCNSAPPTFTLVQCSQAGVQTICGQYGGYLYQGLSYRDTDWYQIEVPPRGATITWQVRGESDTLLGILNGNTGCPVTSFYTYTYGARCTDLSVTSDLGPGTWWLWVGTLNFGTAAGPCGQDYVATLTGLQCEPLAIEPITWGRVKNMYK
jgi:hypothetical protein